MAGAVVGGLIGAAGQMGAASIQAKAQRDAAASQERIARENIALQQGIYDKNYNLAKGYYDPGLETYNALIGMLPNLTGQLDYGDYSASQDYKLMGEDLSRANAYTAAKASQLGTYGGGGHNTQEQKNAAYLMDQMYGDWANRQNANRAQTYNMYSGIAGTGLQAMNSLVGSGNQFASNSGNILSSVGNTQANALANSGKAWGGAIENIGKLGGGIATSADESGYFSGANDWLKNLLGSNQQGNPGITPTYSSMGFGNIGNSFAQQQSQPYSLMGNNRLNYTDM